MFLPALELGIPATTLRTISQQIFVSKETDSALLISRPIEAISGGDLILLGENLRLECRCTATPMSSESEYDAGGFRGDGRMAE